MSSSGHAVRAAALFAFFLFMASEAGAEKWISPEFSLSLDDLGRMTSGLTAKVREGILARPSAFLGLMAKVLDQPAEFLVLVDKKHPLPADYVPPDLVSLKGFPLRTTWPNLMLRKAIMPSVLEMARCARADGVILTFSSAYRSYEYQRGIFEREVKMYGKETAERESAQPGLSQHQLGTAMDFDSITDSFADTKAGRWLVAHGEEYGFSLSYPEGYEQVTGYRHESWHYRYITRIGALVQREYFNDVQQYFLEFLNDNRATLEQARVKRGPA